MGDPYTKWERQIASEYRAGDSVTVLRERYGVGWQTVLDALRNRGVNRRSASEAAKTRVSRFGSPRCGIFPKNDVERERDILALLGKHSYAEIAGKLGLTRCQVAGIVWRFKRRGKTLSEALNAA